MKGDREISLLLSSGVQLSRTSLLLIFTIFAAFLLLNRNSAEAYVTHVTEKCGADSNNATEYAPNSAFRSNLNRLLSSLSSSSNSAGGGYYRNYTVGNGGSDAVYGAALCRGDVSAALCQECISTAAGKLVKNCGRVRSAIIWFDECKLRYSNASFYSQLAKLPGLRLRNTANVSDVPRFKRLLGEVMNDTVKRAVADRKPPKMFAVREENFTSLQKLHALAQCTPDITAADCDRCLKAAMEKFPTFGSQGAQVLAPSCYLRYELYPFYNLTAVADAEPPPPPSPPILSPPALVSGPKERKKIKSTTVVAFVVPIAVFLLLLPVCWCLRRRAMKKYAAENGGNAMKANPKHDVSNPKEFRDQRLGA